MSNVRRMTTNVSAVEPVRPAGAPRRGLIVAGWTYVGYHLLLVALGTYEALSRYWDLVEFLGEMAVGLVLYPVLVPGLAMCGGLHGGCNSVLGVAAQLTVLGLTLAWSITGWRVVILACRRSIQRRKGES